jgi:HK97 family phage prohead protease
MKNTGIVTAFNKDFGSQVKDIDQAKGIVTVYINAFDNEDTDGDISAPGSFKRTFKHMAHRIKHLLNHDIYKLIGVPLKLWEDQIGAIARSQLNMNKELGRDVFEDYKLYAEHGKSLEHSVRVYPVNSVRVYPVKRDTDNNQIVLEWKMWEYSTLYGWGANEETPLIDLKSLDEVNINELLADLNLMITKGNYSDTRGRKIEETYEQLKNLLDPSSTQKDPPGTQETDPPGTPDDPPDTQKGTGILTFLNSIKI